MKSVQITVDEETLSKVDGIGNSLGLTRSEIVRQALREWMSRQAVQAFEQEWIAALRKNPDDADRAEDWVGSQSWSEK